MKLINLIRNTSVLCDKYSALAKASGENYNLFKIIDLKRDEVKVHSAFLAHLLNPLEDHGMGGVFLQLFINELKIEGFVIEKAIVKKEYYIGPKTSTTGGELDIVLIDRNGFNIIIENKINARDQENQLIRYYNYGIACKKYKMFYLTLEGTLPDEDKSCIDPNTKYKLKIDTDYELLSYKSNVLKWLNKCREKAVNKPLLREGISHYINLVKYLTNQTMNENLKIELEAELLKKENIKSLSVLKEAISSAEESLQLKFWKMLESKFISEGYQVTESNYEEYISRFYSLSKNNKYYGFEVLAMGVDGVNILYGVRINQAVYGGFTIREDGDNSVNDKKEYANYREVVLSLEAKHGEYIDNNKEFWLATKTLTPYLNFKNLNETVLNHLVNLEESIDQLFGVIDYDIKLFQAKMGK